MRRGLDDHRRISDTSHVYLLHWERFVSFPQRRHILCLLATSYISLRNSWAAVSVGRRSLIASFIRRLPHMLVPHSGKCGNRLVSLPGQDVGSSEAIAYRVALPADFPLISLTHFSFFLFNLCYFDEPTPPGVTMTESHTRGASRGRTYLFGESIRWYCLIDFHHASTSSGWNNLVYRHTHA